jgi:hypothetical protein
MEKINTKINAIIENYFYSQKQTDYAIMINGKWGCGKTYYIEHDLKNLIINKKFKYIYISLNGYENFKIISTKIAYHLFFNNDKLNIDDDLFENLLGLGSELSKLNTSANGFYKTFDKVKNIIVKSIEGKVVSNIKPNRIVIIFDDVERISNDSLRNDAIGLIYENYTKKGYKTILVGDETNITDKKYHTIKEKVIRRTISYEPDRMIQLEDFINNQFHGSEHKPYLINNKERIIGYFIELQITNLRTISFIIDNFIYILENIDDDIQNRFGDYILKNIMILTNEYKLGNITIDNLKDKKELMHLPNTYFMNSISNRNGEEVKRTYLDDFHDKYIAIQTFSDFQLIPELFDFILTGYLDANKLDKEIKSLFYDEFMDDSEKTFNVLTREWGDLEEKEIANEVDKMIHFLEEGKYHTAKLPYIYTYLKFIQENKFLSNWSHNIEKTLCRALLKATKNLDMIPDEANLIGYHNKFDENRPNDEFYNELIEKIKTLSGQKKLTKKKDKITTIFKAIINNDKSYYDYLHDNYSLFQDIIETESEESFFGLTNCAIGILQSHIYSKILRISNAGDSFYDEKKALEKIINHVEKSINDHYHKLDNFRIIRLKQLIDSMKQAVDHLEKTHRHI